MHARLDFTLKRFVEETKRYPVLTREREREIATAWHDRRDRAALDELVCSHLRFVVKIARGFVGYGLPLADLVAEGNVGLMQAVEKFEPERGFRFATYAMWWIRAAIHDYILRSWSLVKIGTTAAQKKLFFNLRRLKARLEEFDHHDLAPESVTAIATELDVLESEVVEMNGRMGGADSSLNMTLGGDSDSEWLELVADEQPTQEAVVIDFEESRCRRNLLGAALKTLDPREREIVVERHLKDEPTTLEELSLRYAVSRERIRQIEGRGMAKLQKAVVARSARPLELIA